MNTISVGITKQSLKALDELEYLSIEIDSLLTAPASLAFPNTLGSNLNMFKSELSRYSLKFKNQLREILPKVRGSAEGGEIELVNLVKKYENSPFEVEKAKEFLGRRNRELGTISLFMRQAGRVPFGSHGSRSVVYFLMSNGKEKTWSARRARGGDRG